MCELFAMSSRQPSTVNYSLNEFSRHGGLTHSNKSGWGIAYFSDQDAFIIREPSPASDSPWVDFVASQDLESSYVIAHVRKASRGQPALRNTHPFRRSLGGRTHVFAHNGTLHGIHETAAAQHLTRLPVGETDSELAFCLLLQRLEGVWTHRDAVPELEPRMEVFTRFCAEMATLGAANFLYADSDALFVHGHRRIYEENGGFSEPQPPGLSMRHCELCAQGPEWACDGLKIKTADQTTTVFASVPLEDQGWEALPEGTAIASQRGVEMLRRSTLSS